MNLFLFPAGRLRTVSVLLIFFIYWMPNGYSQSGRNIPALKDSLAALKKTDLAAAERFCSEKMENAAPSLRAYLQLNRGIVRMTLQKMPEALRDMEEVGRWAASNPEDSLQAYVLVVQGTWWQLNGRPDSAAAFLESALAAIKPQMHWTIRADCLELLGLLYESTLQFEKAAKALEASYQISADKKDESRQSRTLLALGYIQQNSYAPAKAYASYQNARTIALRTKDKGMQSIVLIKLGAVTCELAETEKTKSKYWLTKSLNYYREALELEQSIGRKISLAILVPQMARTLFHLDGPEAALNLLQPYRRELELNDNNYDLSEYWYALALIYHAREDATQSEEAAMRFLGKQQNRHSKEKQEILILLAEINRKQGDFQKADKFITQALSETQTLEVLRDSILGQEHIAQIAALENRLKMDEEIIQSVKYRSVLLLSLLLVSAILLIAGAVFTVIIIRSKDKLRGVLLILKEQNRVLSEQKSEIEQLIQSKNQLFSQIAYEIRTPLTLSKIPAEILDSDYATEFSTGAHYLLQSIIRNLNNLQDFAQEIANLSEQEPLAPALHLYPISLPDFAADIRYSFALLTQTKQIHFHCNLHLKPDTDILLLDGSKIEKIVLTLILNAFNTINNGGEITLEIKTQYLPDRSVDLEIAIVNKHHKALKAYLENAENAPGQSSGLLIAGKLAERMGGRLESGVFPNQTVRTTLRLQCLPASLQQLEAVPLLPPAPPEILLQHERPAVYLLEDDTDTAEIMTIGLQNSFRVVHFEDEESFLSHLNSDAEKAEMMIATVNLNGIDGIKLLRAVRKNPSTRLLPVIMVSGHSLSTLRSRAYQEGAEDYLIKPIRIRELIPRINHLISRDRLRQTEQQTEYVQAPPSENMYQEFKERILADVPAENKDWVVQGLNFIEENISNTDLVVGMLARELAVSDRQLFRFIKKFTGFSPNQLIHEARLCTAYHLLATNPDISIARVSLQAGFDNSGYFSVVFKKRFGKNPSNLRTFLED